MFLSRLVLNTRLKAVRDDLADCQGIHRSLMRAFPAAPASAPGRAHAGLLFRLEPERSLQAAGGRPLPAPLLLVQSTLRPAWEQLPAGYLLAPPVCKDIAAALGTIEDGAALRFRLRANVVKAQLDPEQAPGQHSRGKRVLVHGEANQIAWLARKGEAGGFRLRSVPASPAPGTAAGELHVPAVRVAPEDDVLGRRLDPHTGGRARLTLGAVLFEGALEVVEAAKLRETVAQGVGPGKAYGFGLLSLARAGG